MQIRNLLLVALFLFALGHSLRIKDAAQLSAVEDEGNFAQVSGRDQVLSEETDAADQNEDNGDEGDEGDEDEEDDDDDDAGDDDDEDEDVQEGEKGWDAYCRRNPGRC